MLAHLPNLVTLTRLLGGLGLFGFYQPDRAGLWVLPLFAALALSDALDGYWARRWGVASRLGQVLDPLADKALIWGLALPLWSFGLLPGIFILVLALRDSLLLLGGGFLLWRGGVALRDLRPGWPGKLTTAVLMLLLGLVLVHHHLGILPRDIVAFLVFTGPVMMLMSLWTYTNLVWRTLWKEEAAA